MTKEEAIEKFQHNNNLLITEYNSDRRTCRNEGKKQDPYIGEDIFGKNLDMWLSNFDVESQKDLLKLLENYTYISKDQYGIYLDEIVDCIIENNDGDQSVLNHTYFITFPSSKGIRSGGDVIRAELPLGYMGEITKNQIIVKVDSNIKLIEKNAKIIVFIDDIIGSGKTAYKNIMNCLEQFDVKKNNKKIYLATMFAKKEIIESKIELLKQDHYEVIPILINECKSCLEKGYIFSDDEFDESYQKITVIEEEIAGKKLNDVGSYALGFEKSEMIISFYYNTPNNTLCMFWKPTKCNYPLFLRTSFRRPNVDIIKKNRENRKKNSYEAKRILLSHNEANNNTIIH